MHNWSVKYKSNSDSVAAYQKAKTIITNETLAQFNVSANLEYLDQEKTIRGKGKGFTMQMKFTENEVEMGLELSFLFKAFRSKIVSILNGEIDKAL